MSTLQYTLLGALLLTGLAAGALWMFFRFLAVSNARAALRVWLRDEGLVLVSARPARVHPFTADEIEDRRVLRFEAMDRDGKTWRGGAVAGRWSERAIVTFAWDETPPKWGDRPVGLSGNPGKALGAIRRVREDGHRRRTA